MEELKKIPAEFMCMSDHDLLRYSGVNVLGVTQPQIYVKVKGNWTGGHQENLCVRATNLNHGPASSVWHCVGGDENIKKFRKLALKQFKIDILKQEGLWFADIDFCIGNGIPVTTFNQRAGDMVILKPGTLHWVRSLGLTTQTAWNFASPDVNQLQHMNNRLIQNQKVNFNTIIPFVTMCYNILRNPGPEICMSVLRYCFEITEPRINEHVKKLQSVECEVQLEQNQSQMQCDQCQQELFLFYCVLDESEPVKNQHTVQIAQQVRKIVCYKCAGNKNKKIFTRHDVPRLKEVLKNVKNKLNQDTYDKLVNDQNCEQDLENFDPNFLNKSQRKLLVKKLQLIVKSDGQRPDTRKLLERIEQLK